jgi:hypothetical protein
VIFINKKRTLELVNRGQVRIPRRPKLLHGTGSATATATATASVTATATFFILKISLILIVFFIL